MDHNITSKLSSLSKKELSYLNQLASNEFLTRFKIENKTKFEIFDSDELRMFEESIKKPSAQPLHKPNAIRNHTFLIMKATRLCNLRCTYCHSWREGPGNVMPFEVLLKTTKDVLTAPNIKRIDFIWHGGEVTLLNISFMKKALWLQAYFAKEGQIVTNSLQTNATHLTDEWISLIKSFDIEVGVSIDGPPDIHDKYRLKVNGKGSFTNVIEGLEKLNNNNIPYGALAVVNEDTIKYGAEEYLNFLIKMNFKGVALLNAIPEEYSPKDNESYLPWAKYVEFLSELFDLWWPRYSKTIAIRELQALVENTQKKTPIVCEFAGDCMGQFLTIEPSGVISACDKYIGDKTHIFGNILDEDLNTLLLNSSNLESAVKKANAGIKEMNKCKYFEICNGGCPHDVQLNMQNSNKWSGECCGMDSLLSQINTSISKQTINLINI